MLRCTKQSVITQLLLISLCLLCITITERRCFASGDGFEDEDEFDQDEDRDAQFEDAQSSQAGDDDDDDDARIKSRKVSTKNPHYDEDGHHNDEYDHEAVTGSHEEANEYKELSPEESKKRLAVLLEKIDTNYDGIIDKTELKEWIIKSFENLDREDAQTRMDNDDANKDKLVDWWEYVANVYGYNEKEINEMRNQTNTDSRSFITSLNEEKLKFDLADVDKNGKLDLEEYKAFLHPEHYIHMADYEVNQTLGSFDKNKDGFINEIEFLSKDTKDQAQLAAEKEHFKQYDVNKDGKLDRIEIIKWIIPGFTKSASEEVDHLFAETDTNKDGKLQKAEILEQSDVWVGSHATDYGRHLEELTPKTEL